MAATLQKATRTLQLSSFIARPLSEWAGYPEGAFLGTEQLFMVFMHFMKVHNKITTHFKISSI
jgi:hypothetical protein